jgi:hypothetical protein
MATSTERSREHRARKRALAEAADRPLLRDASSLLLPMVEATLLELGLDGQDVAAGALAREYARAIDESRDRAWSLRWLGPLLQTALNELHASPKSRQAMKQTAPAVQAPPSRLAQLREAHATGTKPGFL